MISIYSEAERPEGQPIHGLSVRIVFIELRSDLGDYLRGESSDDKYHQSYPLEIPNFSSDDELSTPGFDFMSLGYDLRHFDVTLGLETTHVMISFTLIVNCNGCQKVEAAETKHIYAHE